MSQFETCPSAALTSEASFDAGSDTRQRQAMDVFAILTGFFAELRRMEYEKSNADLSRACSAWKPP